MARRKKTKTGKKAKGEAEALEGPMTAHHLFLDNCLEEIEKLKSNGLIMKSEESENPLLKQLESLVSPQELEILKTSGAFGKSHIETTNEGDEFIKSRAYQKYVFGSPGSTVSARFRPPPPPVPIYADLPGKSSSLALAGELRYLSTVLNPSEMRWLVAELACDSLEKAPVTHTDISDAVIASIAPSTAQKVAFQADAQYKYTTAQFLQVYMKMRHVVLEHKIMLGGARADAMLLALSPYEFEKPRPEDEVPVSAVEALRKIIDSENMLR